MRIRMMHGVFLALLMAVPATADDTPSFVVTVSVAHEAYPNQRETDIARGQLGDYQSSGTANDRDPRDLALVRNVGKYLFANGVCVGPGKIAVPYHVVDGATKIYVRGPKLKGSYANILASDARSELAVLELIQPIEGIKPVRLARDSTIRLGQAHTIEAILPPTDRKVENGRVAALNQKIDTPPEILFGGVPAHQPFVCYGTLGQSSAALAKTVSGAGLFNANNELIGLTTTLAAVAGSDQTSGYFIPIDSLFRPILETLTQGKEVEYGFLGITWGGGGFGPGRFRMNPRFGGRGLGQMVADDPNGIIIGGVSPGMPAEEAGLQPGDQLAAVNGMPVSSQTELQFRIAAALTDRPTELTIRRNGKELPPVKVRLVKSKNDMPFIASNKPAAVFGIHVDHWSTIMQDIMRNEREARSMIVPKGVVISSIDPGSPAERRFTEINRRYIITAVNGQPTESPADFEAATAGKKSVRLKVARVGDISNRQFEVTLP